MPFVLLILLMACAVQVRSTEICTQQQNHYTSLALGTKEYIDYRTIRPQRLHF